MSRACCLMVARYLYLTIWVILASISASSVIEKTPPLHPKRIRWCTLSMLYASIRSTAPLRQLGQMVRSRRGTRTVKYGSKVSLTHKIYSMNE